MKKQKSKTGSETPDKRWDALQGRTFNGRNNAGATQCKVGQKVPVQEYAKSVIIPPDKNTTDPYGIPIDAKLAINLISDFHAMLPKLFQDKFIDGEDIVIDFMQEENVHEEFQQGVNDLTDMLRRSCAITIDKNILLKTLSQPKCEGLRFYLCKKTLGTDSFLSLVTVGVDAEGNDHLYHYPEDGEVASTNLQSTSLLSEYGHPPGSTNLDGRKLGDIYGYPYALLHYALDITQQRRMGKSQSKNQRKKK